MTKVVATCRRRSDLSVDAFQQHWRTTHAQLVSQQPGLNRYVQNHVVATEADTHCDGVAEAWFDDRQALRDLSGTAQTRAILADEANFVEPGTIVTLLTDEIVVVDGPVSAGALKLFVFVRSTPNCRHESFLAFWRDVIGPLEAAIPGVRRYLQCPVQPDLYTAGRTPTYDGVAIMWFDDMGSVRNAQSGAAAAAVAAARKGFVDCPVQVITRPLDVDPLVASPQDRSEARR